MPREARPGEDGLRGNLSAVHLFFSVMAWNAPLVIVVGVIPVMLTVGNGIAIPVAFVAAGLILGAFAVGFTRMARVLPNPGAFYAYITAGLGREIGLGSGVLALFGYFCGYAGTFAFGGVVLNSLLENTFGGIDVPWWALAFLVWGAVAALGYCRIDLSAKVLAVFLVAEVAVIVAYDVAVFAQGGAAGLSAAPLDPSRWFDGSFGIALLYGLGMYGGFEVTALYRDEVRDPIRTVPRATYAVLIFGMLLYGATAWLFINALGIDEAVATASADPTAAVEGTMQQFGGKLLLDLSTALVTTSTVAVLLAGHNIVSRYVFNLSADRILPSRLSGVHARQGSPHVASVATSVAALLANVPVIVLNLEPMRFYAAMLGIASFVLIVAILLTDIAVPLYMRRHGGELATFWATVACPFVAAVGLVTCVVLAADNFEILIGGSASLATVLLLLIGSFFLAGVCMAAIFRRTRPEIYAKIGRQ
ncbi:APC family permease [Saccharopolyspora mangrovi]|uniref:APC family permease n=1 Tax=Saccharopolyspora mangrovi TaxID=3082379 RepID=A0ABU6AG60_9PSEU|nr:APC family permease [Saccharopolyspora sp. S2-29]MEB3370540.1 APC family permease [Saccharopolyspora sp. S2-29]